MPGGGRIVSLLRSTMSDLTGDDGHMRKVVGESAWRYSLMNWGNTTVQIDPLGSG